MGPSEKDWPKASPLFVGSVHKSFELLDRISRAGTSLSLKEITALSGIERSAVQRLVYTLHQIGILHKDEASKRYRIAVRALALGHTFLRTEPLVAFAVPYLEALSRELQQTVNLTVLDDCDVVYVSRFAGPRPVSPDVQVGARRPAYCTAMGRAILSRMTDEEVADILARSDLRAYTRHTLTEAQEINKAIGRTRKEGVAVTAEELLLNDLSIAAPIDAMPGALRAAVNVSLKLDSVDREKIVTELAPKILATAHSISLYHTEL
jgi:IclR family transcriptional regulator, pca regulon regulatory protein